MLPLQCTALMTLALATGGQSRFLGKRKPEATWRSWRYGIHSTQQDSDAFLQDGPPEWTFSLEYLRISFEKVRSCSKSALYHPSSALFDEGAEDTRLSVKLVNEAAHIYLLCVECDKVSIPSTWKGKVTLANGQLSDKCLGITHRHHYVKATLAHKLLLADAKSKNYSDVFVLEEDWVGRKDARINADEVGRFYRQGDWQVFRPSFHANLPWDTMSGCYETCLCEMQPASNDLCTLPAHCTYIQSSAAYAVKHHNIDRFIETDGNIDQAVLNSLPATLVLPPIFYQRIWVETALRNEGKYVERCLGQKPVPQEDEKAAVQKGEKEAWEDILFAAKAQDTDEEAGHLTGD